MSAASAATPLDASPRADLWTIGAVGTAHFTSHVLQLALAPVLPLMARDFGVGFTQLGFVLAIMYASSAAGQVLAGVLVDRLGPHRLLIAGVALQGASVIGFGLAPSYGALIPLALGAGLGNSVYHPADLSILSHRVSAPRLGRAFAAHNFAGVIGFGTSPILVGTIAAVAGWRPALVTAGAIGLAVALALLASRTHLATAAARREEAHRQKGRAGEASFARIVAMPVVLLAFAYFVLTAFAGAGIQSFAIAALGEGYGATLAFATLAVAAYQLANAAGSLFGGYLADRGEHHHRIAMTGLALAALMVGTAAQPGLSLPLVTALLAGAGFANGATAPSRDVLVRRAAPDRGVGKVFGIVYSGFDVGNLLAPLAYGAVLDRHAPNLVFALTAAALAMAIFTVLGVGARTRVEPRPVSR